MRALLVTRQFERDAAKIPTEIIAQADLVILKIRQSPTDPTLDIKKLKGFKPPIFRVRIGAYRLIFSLAKTAVTLHRFRHRKDIYRRP